MIIKRIFDKSVSKLNSNELKDSTSSTPIIGKAQILAYLRKFPECAFTSEPVRDGFTDKIVYDANNARTDGTYTWYETEIYHFEKYNLKLNDDFIEYVLKHS